SDSRDEAAPAGQSVTKNATLGKVFGASIDRRRPLLLCPRRVHPKRRKSPLCQLIHQPLPRIAHDHQDVLRRRDIKARLDALFMPIEKAEPFLDIFWIRQDKSLN